MVKKGFQMFKNQRILVTGGAGFIGSTLVKRLVKEGAHVQVVDNLWRGSLDNLKLPDNSYAIDLETNFHNADLTDYSKSLEHIRDIDLVYHLADVVGGIHFVFGNETFIFRQNILINTNVLSACIVNNIPNYIYVGTACSFPKYLQMNEGISALREDQTYPAEPESSYGWSKLMGEYEAEVARKSKKINVGLLRFHNVYGPGASFDPRHSQVIPSLIRKAILYTNDKFVVWGSGKQYRDFLYIDDAVESLLLLPLRGMNKGVIQIGSEKATSICEIAKNVVEISKKDIPIFFDNTKPEGDRGRIAVCDRARSILDWEARTDLKNGLINTYEWMAQKLQSFNISTN
jgi:GDP-D-mannose 3',5'-epimerase